MLVLGLSLLLLLYVADGEAHRTYPTLETDRLSAEGEIVKGSIETFLQAGLPLRQFSGFSTLTRPLLRSDPTIAAVVVADQSGAEIFASTRTGDETPEARGAMAPVEQRNTARYAVRESAGAYEVRLPLRDKFEQVGTLSILMPRTVVSSRISAYAGICIVTAGALVAMLGLGVLLLARGQARPAWLGSDPEARGTRALYIAALCIMAAAMAGLLADLYAGGLQGKARSLADSLAQRLQVPLELGLELQDFEGLDDVVREYQELNPDLSFVALTRGDTILIHTDARQVGARWQSYPGHFEYTSSVQSPGGAQLAVHTGIPYRVVAARLWHTIKNFLVLLVACAFISALLFNLMRILAGTSESQAAAEQQLGLMRPLYFLTVFTEGLIAPFLPQYFHGLALTAQADPAIVSTLFTVYFAAFVLALVPAGRYAERFGVRPLLVAGSLLTALSLLLLALVTSFWAMFVLRAIAGIGQSILYIGVQSYILEVAAGGQKTRGAAIIVFGYNGGMISGAAIGALLAANMGPHGVFAIGAGIALLVLGYVLALVPRRGGRPRGSSSGNTASFRTSLSHGLRDVEFVKTILLIGIPAKAVLTGVTIFALPLILTHQNYAQEDIGQIIMLYAAGVLLSSTYVAQLTDRLGRTTAILFFGGLCSGLGLILIGMMDWPGQAPGWPAALGPITLIAGMVVLGLAHGCIHAPIITHISNTAASQLIGKSSTASLYRLLERIGHMLGPILVSQVLLLDNQRPRAISWLGIAVIICGVLFLVRLHSGAGALRRVEQSQ